MGQELSFATSIDLAVQLLMVLIICFATGMVVELVKQDVMLFCL